MYATVQTNIGKLSRYFQCNLCITKKDNRFRAYLPYIDLALKFSKASIAYISNEKMLVPAQTLEAIFRIFYEGEINGVF